MGGKSYQCPCCKKWYLEMLALREHLKSKHKMPTDAVVSGTGPAIFVTADGEPWPTSASQ
jgi:hypothetical protein